MSNKIMFLFFFWSEKQDVTFLIFSWQENKKSSGLGFEIAKVTHLNAGVRELNAASKQAGTGPIGSNENFTWLFSKA